MLFFRIANIPQGAVVADADSVGPVLELQERMGLDPKVKDLTISLGNHPASPHRKCDTGRDDEDEGNFIIDIFGNPLISVCLSTFDDYPDRAEIESPPP